jgi:hypothetical protein
VLGGDLVDQRRMRAGEVAMAALKEHHGSCAYFPHTAVCGGGADSGFGGETEGGVVGHNFAYPSLSMASSNASGTTVALRPSRRPCGTHW